ncbi:hypothetical protein BD289DRAFT_448774, partial [Coniella lustricola]
MSTTSQRESKPGWARRWGREQQDQTDPTRLSLGVSCIICPLVGWLILVLVRCVCLFFFFLSPFLAFLSSFPFLLPLLSAYVYHSADDHPSLDATRGLWIRTDAVACMEIYVPSAALTAWSFWTLLIRYCIETLFLSVYLSRHNSSSSHHRHHHHRHNCVNLFALLYGPFPSLGRQILVESDQVRKLPRDHERERERRLRTCTSIYYDFLSAPNVPFFFLASRLHTIYDCMYSSGSNPTAAEYGA